ncbi:hypothetical protein E3O05_25145, partial [Escherichia coli]|uniref:Ig-like domain-containing protein n=1 Tax=Escherichia coli TaxID=562 RepID=UPI0011010394
GLPSSATLTAHWSSDNSDVATVNPLNGELTLLKAGVVNISVLTLPTDTYTSGTANYQLTVEKADPGINFAVAKRDVKWMDSMSPQNFVLSNSDANQSDIKTIWQTDSGKIATVDKGGLVTLVKLGTTNVTVSFVGDERFKYGEASYELNVAKYKPTVSFANSL